MILGKDQSRLRQTNKSHNFAKNIWKLVTAPMIRDASSPTVWISSERTINTTQNIRPNNAAASKTTTFAFTETDATSSMWPPLLIKRVIPPWMVIKVLTYKWNSSEKVCKNNQICSDCFTEWRLMIYIKICIHISTKTKIVRYEIGSNHSPRSYNVKRLDRHKLIINSQT